MEGTFSMITNRARHLHKAAEDAYFQNDKKFDPTKRKGLFKRPEAMAAPNLNDPLSVVNKYFTSIRKKREEFNGTA